MITGVGASALYKMQFAMSCVSASVAVLAINSAVRAVVSIYNAYFILHNESPRHRAFN